MNSIPVLAINVLTAEFERRPGESLRMAALRALKEGDPTAWTIVAVTAGLILLAVVARIVSKKLMDG